MSGLEAVMSRISEIESRFGSPSATSSEQVLGTTGSSTTSASTAAATRARSDLFASALGTASATGSIAANPVSAGVPSAPSLAAATSTALSRSAFSATTLNSGSLGLPTTSGPVSTRPVVTRPVLPQQAATAPAAGTTGLGEAAVTAARAYLGVPYRWGGTDPATGLDCSGLVQLVYGQLGVKLPRTAATQAKVGTSVPDLAHARPGDLVVFRGGHHIGIYLGDGKMIHAPKTGDVVKISGMQGHGAIFAIRRVENTAVPATAAAGSQKLSGTAVLDQLNPTFKAAESRYGLPAGLLRAVATVESGGRVDAVSRVGAQGLMQLMPATARGLGVNPLDPAQAIDGAARLLRSNLKTFGDIDLALAAYNAGPGAVRRHHGIPPYTETQNYVRKVRAILAGGN